MTSLMVSFLWWCGVAGVGLGMFTLALVAVLAVLAALGAAVMSFITR